MEHMLEKKKILDLLKNMNIYYSDFEQIIKTSRTKFTFDDALNFLTEKSLKVLSGESEKVYSSLFARMILSINIIISCRVSDGFKIEDKTIQTIDQIFEKREEQTIDFLDELANKQLDDLKTIITELGIHVQEPVSKTEQETTSQPEQSKQLEEELQQTKKLITDYEQQIKAAEKQIHKLEKALKKDNKTTETLKNQNQELSTKIKELKKIIEQYKRNELSFQKDINTKELTITNLTEIKETLQNEIQILKTNIEQLKQEIADLNTTLDDYYKKDKQELLTEQIRNLILTQLYHQPTSMEELQKILALNGQQASIAQINEHLNLLKHRIHISGPFFSTIPPTYQIDTTPVVTPAPLYLSVTPEKNESEENESKQSVLDILILQ